MKKVRVFAPASIANMGCGFDIIGLALDDVGDIIEIVQSEGDGLTITNKSGVPLPDDIEKNVITPVIRKFLEMTGQKAQIDVTVCEKIYPGSGIGSSAASSAAAAYGMNELYGCPLTEEEVVLCAMEGENLASGGYHADNAAPAVMGGIILIRGYEPLDVVKISVPGNFYCSVVHPHIVVTTKEAREILPKEVPLHNAIRQWAMWAVWWPDCLPATSDLWDVPCRTSSQSHTGSSSYRASTSFARTCWRRERLP